MNERLQGLADRFFDRIVSLCQVTDSVNFVVVTHLLEDRPWFLRAIEKLGRVAAVIPKRKSIVPRVRDMLRHRYLLLEVPRSALSTTEGIRNCFRTIGCHDRLCILDIGGYFAAATHGVPDLDIVAIVEDTENGHLKYEEAIRNGPCRIPIGSVARSKLKRPENFLVGQSLVFSVEAILREHDELLHGRRACVIGYGNIGRSVVQHLHERHVEVTVFDRDPMKLVEAFTHGFRTAETTIEALRDAEIVFCVTGNRSIGPEELATMRPHTYIATVTSPDDEFDQRVLDLHISHRPKNVSEYRRIDGSSVLLMNRGQAVNFVHGSVVGPFIQLLQAEILLTASQMISSRGVTDQIRVISPKDQAMIAHEWLKVYRH